MDLSFLPHRACRYIALAAVAVLGPARTGTGKVYLFFGMQTFPGYNDEKDAEAYAGVVFQGEDAEDRFGNVITAGGDVNGDGVHDVVISSFMHAETTEPQTGRVYVFLMPSSYPGTPTFDQKHWDAAEANLIIDGDSSDSFVNFGRSVACNGNTNNGTGTGRDTRNDLLIGSPRKNSCLNYFPNQLEDDRGGAYLFRYSGSMTVGEDGGQELWDVTDAIAEYQITCHEDYDRIAPSLGYDLLFIGDADGDADDDDDFVIGCPGWDTVQYPTDPDDRGGVYLIRY